MATETDSYDSYEGTLHTRRDPTQRPSANELQTHEWISTPAPLNIPVTRNGCNVVCTSADWSEPSFEIDTEHVLVISGFARAVMEYVSADILNIVLHYYAQPISVKLKRAKEIKYIGYCVLDDSFDSIIGKVEKAFDLDYAYLRHKQYKNQLSTDQWDDIAMDSDWSFDVSSESDWDTTDTSSSDEDTSGSTDEDTSSSWDSDTDTDDWGQIQQTFSFIALPH
eukprot:617826_1